MIALDFNNKVALVTGGARGVGRGVAQCFLAAGANVIVCGRNAPETPPEAQGCRAQFVHCDVREEQQVETLVQQIVKRHGRLDVLVANAGGAPPAEAASASPRFHNKIVGLNLLAPLLCAQHANRQMQQQQFGGVILFIGSVSGARPSPGTAAYGAAKAGLNALARSLAVEWAPRVRVLSVAAGMVQTEQAHLHFGGEAGVAAAAATVPLQRLAAPEDVGNACVFLASPLAAYASGVELMLHGGGEAPAFLEAVQKARNQ